MVIGVFEPQELLIRNKMAAANKEGSHLVSNFSIRALLSVREEPSDRVSMFVKDNVDDDKGQDIN